MVGKNTLHGKVGYPKVLSGLFHRLGREVSIQELPECVNRTKKLRSECPLGFLPGGARIRRREPGFLLGRGDLFGEEAGRLESQCRQVPLAEKKFHSTGLGASDREAEWRT